GHRRGGGDRGRRGALRDRRDRRAGRLPRGEAGLTHLRGRRLRDAHLRWGGLWRRGLWWMGLSRGRLRRRGLGALSHEERAHLFAELLGVEGLSDVVIGAHLRTPGLIVGAVLAREQDHAGRGGFPLDLLSEIVAAGPGQEGVEQDDRGPVHPKFLERLVRAPGEL